MQISLTQSGLIRAHSTACYSVYGSDVSFVFFFCVFVLYEQRSAKSSAVFRIVDTTCLFERLCWRWGLQVCRSITSKFLESQFPLIGHRSSKQTDGMIGCLIDIELLLSEVWHVHDCYSSTFQSYRPKPCSYYCPFGQIHTLHFENEKAKHQIKMDNSFTHSIRSRSYCKSQRKPNGLMMSKLEWKTRQSGKWALKLLNIRCWRQRLSRKLETPEVYNDFSDRDGSVSYSRSGSETAYQPTMLPVDAQLPQIERDRVKGKEIMRG